MRKKQFLQIAKEQQTAKLAEIGERLNQARRQLDISLENVADRTHIQTRLLRAIEEGRLDDLPESVYVQSFIRQYANAIGLNGLHFASEFADSALPQRSKTPWFKSLPVFSGVVRPVHLYAGYLVLVAASVQGVSGLMNQSNAQPEITPDSLQKFKEGLPASAMTQMGPNPAQLSVKSATPVSNVRVGITATDQSWVRVMADGKQAFEGVLTEGVSRDWNAKKQLVVKAGNAGAIMVKFNDGKAAPLGAPGTVQEVAFPPTQVTASRLTETTIAE